MKRRRSYGDDLPAAEDVMLVMEAAGSIPAFDRGTKLPLYAVAGIAEAWLVDIEGEAIERHTNPIAGTYGVTVRVGRSEVIEGTVFPDLGLKPTTSLLRVTEVPTAKHRCPLCLFSCGEEK